MTQPWSAQWIVTGVHDRFTPEIVERRRAAVHEHGKVVAIGPFAEAAAAFPTRRVTRLSATRHAAGLRQQPSPRRSDAAAAGLARSGAGALVRRAACRRATSTLPRHAVLGLRDDRLGRHHGAAHPRLDARQLRAASTARRPRCSTPTARSACAPRTATPCASRTAWSTRTTQHFAPGCRSDIGVPLAAHLQQPA